MLDIELLFTNVGLTVEVEQRSLDLVHLVLRSLRCCHNGGNCQTGAVERFVVCLKTTGMIPKIDLPRHKLVIDAMQAMTDLREELALILFTGALVQLRHM